MPKAGLKMIVIFQTSSFFLGCEQVCLSVHMDLRWLEGASVLFLPWSMSRVSNFFFFLMLRKTMDRRLHERRKYRLFLFFFF